MVFRYREVGFGTSFVAQAGLRRPDSAPQALAENEIVVDVGGTCLGHAGENRFIFDHHFDRPANFPSAATAVIHHAAVIRERFKGKKEVWIVTHQQPDFDACCAAYLARLAIAGRLPAQAELWLALGIVPGSWEAPVKGRRIDWFSPAKANTGELRGPVLLAAYAACIDNCRKLHVPRTRALHSVLYAAQKRGRDLSERGWALFERALAAITERGLNPLFDSLFEDDPEYSPELRLLDREEELYQQDIRRGRRAIVNLDVNRDFKGWFGRLENGAPPTGQPLFNAQSDGSVVVNNEVLAPARVDGCRQADGIFIRDPQCLLFKEWVRDDLENSQLGAGFLFTAIAYSNQVANPWLPDGNDGAYFFSLDPERAAGANLMACWARVQAAELAARNKFGITGDTQPRPGFVTRSAGFPGHFADPWFDGQNYGGTIVVTPNRGTMLSGGVQADLGDDRVAAIVSEELEYGVYADLNAELTDIVNAPAACPIFVAEPGRASILEAENLRYDSGCYRFAAIPLKDGTMLATSGLGRQIGQNLWQFLEEPGVRTVPVDFMQHHFYLSTSLVAVWNRVGLAIAFLETARAEVEEYRQDLKKLADINLRISRMLESGSADEPLLKDIIALQYKAGLPKKYPLRRFLEMMRFDQLARSIHDLNKEISDRVENEQSQKLGKMLNYITFLFAPPALVFSLLQTIGGASLFLALALPGASIVLGWILLNKITKTQRH
jgi:hypothetical protein